MAATHWFPEDDFRLRKSIEEGATLESLAKGAVKFSRKFTLSELKDRWHSLLYDPKVKSLSSSIGFDLQYSAELYPPRHSHYTTQVKSQYYAPRKRMHYEEPLRLVNNATDEVLNDNVASGVVNEDDGTGLGEYDGFLDDFGFEDIEYFHNSFPDILQFDDDRQGDFDLTRVDDGNGNDDRMVNQLLNINDGQIQDCNFTDTTTTAGHVLSQQEFQDPLFKQPINETTSQSHLQGNPDGAETWIVPESYQNLPSKPEECCQNAMSLDPHLEIMDGVLICPVNCISREVPDNDNFNPQIHNPETQNSVNSASSLRKHVRPPLPPIRGLSLQAKCNDSINSYGFGDCGVTTQATCSSAFKNGFTEKTAASTVAAKTSSSSSLQYSPENEISEQTLTAEMDINTLMSEEEEHHNNEIESDEDLPSFSDVEAMVLDMDLEPLGQDRYELEASRYRNEDIVRMIMRFEQSSESYLNRDMASRGALALLYGSSKHYIKKPEVLLGRATGEYPIDIDLGKSGSETRVSRRQALISLKQDGCFELKNLGKYSIWINEKEIEHGEVVHLEKNSLIQIREMSFIFETNEKAVKKYLDGIRR